MTVTQVKEEYGADADTLCRNLCGYCDANDWYCPNDCKSIEWVRRNYDKAIQRLADLDGDYVALLNRARMWR